MKITKRRYSEVVKLGFAATVSVFGLQGCGGNETRVEVEQPGSMEKPGSRAPVAEAEVAQTMGSAPLDVLFDASASYDLDEADTLMFSWDFGDGSHASREIASHTYTEPGQYLATLTVTDSTGRIGTWTTTITALDAPNTAPTAVISADVRRGAAPIAVELSALQSTDEDGDIVSYSWLLEDGTAFEGPTVSHTFATPGTYAVTLTVVDDEGASAVETLEIVALEPTTTFTVEGTISALPYSDVDSDINDGFATYANNNGHPESNIQKIGNPVLLNGFATASRTDGENDTFRFEPDPRDVFEVDLEEGQYVSLRVIDYIEADLDLYLINADSGLLAGQSQTEGEFESVRAPSAGRYYVEVQALDGAAKYLLSVGRSSLAPAGMRNGQSGDFEPNQAIVQFKPRDPQSVQPLLSTTAAAQLELSHRDQKREALARLNTYNPQTQTVFGLSAVPHGFEEVIARKNPETAAKLETLRAIKRLAQQSDVEIAEPNYRVQPLLVPNDPSYPYQWNLPAMNLERAWDITTGDADVVVAVVDSGIYPGHIELQGQLVPGYDFITSEEAARDNEPGIDADPTDPGDNIQLGRSTWHGTHVTGTIVAKLNNGEGIAGIAPGARVMPLRTLGRGGGSTYDILQAVRFAAGLTNDSGTVPVSPADIINLSLGSAGYSQAAQNLYNQVRERGVIVIAAAGNDSTEEPLYPASYDGVVSVAATDLNGRRAPYSNTGEFIDVAAPGGNIGTDRNNDKEPDGILSLVVKESSLGLSSSYAFYQGSSMAAPHVAGIVALMKSVHPGLSPGDFESLLVSGALTVDAGAEGRDNEYGYGVIDANIAVQAARDLAEGGTTAAIVATPGALFFDDGIDQLTVRVSAIGNGRISVVDARTTAEWLTVAPVEVGERGTGTYGLSVERAGLADGGYRAELELLTDTGTLLQVPVSMRIGEAEVTGDAGYLYILLSAAETLDPIAIVEAAGVEGQYAYKFTDVPIGEYSVSAGSDINNDGLICEDGETCGFYPSFGGASVLVVNENKTGIDFAAGIFSALGPTAQSTNTFDPFNIGLSRRLSK